MGKNRKTCEKDKECGSENLEEKNRIKERIGRETKRKKMTEWEGEGEVGSSVC